MIYSLPTCRVHELRGVTQLKTMSRKDKSDLLSSICSLARENSVLDLIFVNYLQYKETSMRNRHALSLHQFIINSLSTDTKTQELSRLATVAFENPIDIAKDITELQNIANVNLIQNIFTEALIFSQLFKVPLNQNGKPTLHSLVEFSK